ncbi:MAG: DUF3168 domain-containing protein [Hyphomicrobiaceae bacterium]|nr:DUF3168 domain-containing protein [Hyphomicrobiaceae bacterium]
MANAGLELQKAIYQALRSGAEVLGLLGSAKVYDDTPQRTEFPYVTFGQSLVRDWSTGTEAGHEHVITLHVWSRAAGRKQVREIMAAIETVLHDRQLTVAGHSLVNLRHEFSDARRDPDGETYHGTVRFRAVTEPQV